jgi:hypothetical protein
VTPDHVSTGLGGYETIRKDEIEEYVEKYGFPSKAAFFRAALSAGIATMEHLDPHEVDSNSQAPDAVTIRDLIPDGKENAVDVRDELPEMIEDDLLDIVDNDPEIVRDGWLVYK